MHPEIHALVHPYLPPAIAEELTELLGRLYGSARPADSPGRTLPPVSSVQLADPDGNTLGSDEPTVHDRPPGGAASMPARYEDLRRLGVGGMGEVRRVRDRELGRTCAYKAVRPELSRRPNLLARFVEEAQIGAQLQHPNIPPVYDGGLLPDGRPWFTMKEVRGRTFRDQIHEAHLGELTDAVLRRLCDVLAKVCDAVGYAHGRGVIHRDLKPDNVMVGEHGEVYVLDWGLAKVVGRPERALDEADPEPRVETRRGSDDSLKTRAGGVLGTVAFMPPEQARGEVDELDARADVYALGAMLYQLLSGRPPYRGANTLLVLRQVLAGPPAPPVPRSGAALPEELVSLCMRCLSSDREGRPASGAAVAAALRAWMDGAGKRAKALEVVTEAEAVVSEAAALRQQAMALRVEGEGMLAPVKPWASEEEKAPGWARLDEAERFERRAALLELRREALLRGALTHVPDLVEAHAALVELERARHASAEGARDEGGAARAEVRLREHTEALPRNHPARSNAAAYLEGDGALSLVTDEPGAEVLLHRYELRNRRLVEVPVRRLGVTPLHAVSLPMGSYLCVLRHPERAEVRYPVVIGRCEHWDGVPPGAKDPQPIRLPLLGELGADDCLVPAGWFWSGGDPEAVDSLAARRLWCDELVVKRFPVTNREYIAFLDGLVASGREAEAVRHQPRERAAGEGAAVYGRDERGRFVLRPDADGDVWGPDWPVVLVDWFGASAYAAWLAETTGRPWRLPGEFEWEKAARGVDGRHYPWGDRFDPSWACVRASHATRPLPTPVDGFPVDCSPYGVRGCAGNVEDWTADVFRRDGPPLDGDRVWSPPRPVPGDPTTQRCIRGGYWDGSARFARSALRNRFEAGSRLEDLSIRVAWSGPRRGTGAG